MARAGSVPGPTRGSHSACSGGNERTCTFQPASSGTSIAAAISTSATTSPAASAYARPVRGGADTGAGADMP